MLKTVAAVFVATVFMLGAAEAAQKKRFSSADTCSVSRGKEVWAAKKSHRGSYKRKKTRQVAKIARKKCRAVQRPRVRYYAPSRRQEVEESGWSNVVVPEMTLAGPFFDAVRKFLDETAKVGQTMGIQGKDISVGYIHPDFRERLFRAFEQARIEGMDGIGVYSGYRTPALGVGGYKDKAHSCHAYGLAVDVTGIDGPGSARSIRWYQIAKEHGIYNPYGPKHNPEWNHYQYVPQKGCGRFPSVRKTITKNGPVDMNQMWTIGSVLRARGIPSSAKEVLGDGR